MDQTPLKALPRLVPHLLPLVNLGLVFLQQSSSGTTPALLSLLHVFSNPVDALHNILKRQEIVRRCNVFALSTAPDVSREITAVLSIYDQWLGDARPHLYRCLTSRQRRSGRSISDHEPVICEEEKRLLRGAALRLRCCWNGSSLKAKLSILSYLLTLAIAAYRVHTSDEQITMLELGRILSAITLFDHLTFAVYLNGCVGTFNHQEETVRIVFELIDSLTNVHRVAQDSIHLLPRPCTGVQRGDTLVFPSSAADFSRAFAQLGHAAGSINCIRPRMRDEHCTKEHRSHSSLLLISCCAVAVSSAAAIAIPLTTSQTQFNGFLLQTGCLSCWTLNWVISTGCSLLLARNTVGITTYFLLITTLDTIFGVLQLTCLAWSLTTSPNANSEAELLPSTIISWVSLIVLSLGVKGLLLFWVKSGDGNSRFVLSRSRAELLADFDAWAMRSNRRMSL